MVSDEDEVKAHQVMDIYKEPIVSSVGKVPMSQRCPRSLSVSNCLTATGT
jgi:hypothetical protein